ncbi:bifunctional hydroxymethylpyrimidine kinase/phosphomethylpyrimidine kinase [Moraxella bovis]|nr:bifunctional hydroxymethylpyrimidine kinase/phosphomethylpyrimidine kinase [Moraxella bovis]UZA28706.1 bifunctional hydroxymethylpyrimidine kinase/phosphomethylpyrimidine kinase [Moraxella bovis]UZA39181.1 bifunctional hydroxymethylpyrimidine kinase/phosphomethylpyrimidine kinase [Moraxella bovis]UZA44336.1 bifunctional hydroxymethylpyrimidine kinase/phosphomethylpyrimidine kinase [Moraxella bovis]
MSSASKNTHGTGCTFSACITAELAKGASVADAIHTAKRLISQAIRPSPTSDTDMGRSIIGRFGKAGYR